MLPKLWLLMTRKDSIQHLSQALKAVFLKKAKYQGSKDPGMKDSGADRE